MLANFDIDKNPRKNQTFSSTLVEPKRLGRTLSAIVRGLSASQAQSQGLLSDSAAETSSISDAEPLFVEDPDEEQTSTGSRAGTPELKDDTTKLNPNANPSNPTSTPFQSLAPSSDPFASRSAFGKPSVFGASVPAPDFSSISKAAASETEKPNPFGTQPKPKFVFPAVPDTSKQGNNEKSTRATTNASTAQQAQHVSPFGKSPSLPAQAPSISFGTSPLFEINDKGQDSNSAFKSSTSAASKNSTSMPADTIFSKSKAQEPPSATPASLFQFPTSTSTLSPSTTTSSPLLNLSPTPFLFPTKTTPTSNEPPLRQSSSPFPTFFSPTDQSLFPTQADSNQPRNVNSEPSAPKATTLGTFSTPTTLPQSFIFQPSIASVPQTGASQTASPFPSIDTSKPQVQPEIGATPSPLIPNAPRSPFTPVLPPAERAKAKIPRLDPRPAALEKLAHAMVMDDEGLLSQFVEYTIGPIIAASFRQVKDERSWAKASKWSSAKAALTPLELTNDRGSPRCRPRQEVFQEMASQCLEEMSTAQG